MSCSDDEKSDSTTVAEEEARRLKALAAEKHASGDLTSSVKYAKRALKLRPSLPGLPEMFSAFSILRTAAGNPTPDYYEILGVERFCHINTIKKQYKTLALTLHPDKNPLAASAEAFKVVGEAAGVLTDKIRRKEYDMRLRIAMQEEAEKEAGLGAEETFWTACSACRLLHKFDRKYLGHNLVCPRCEKSFKALEVEEGDTGGEAGLGEESVEAVELGQTTRASARIRERVMKGGSLGIVEKCGLRKKRKLSSLEGVEENVVVVVVEEDESVEDDGVLLKDLMPKRVGKVDGSKMEKVRKLVDVDSTDIGGGKLRDEVGKGVKSGGIEIVESARSTRVKAREEENMTLSEMKMLVKKTKRKPVEENREGKEKEGEEVMDKDEESEKGMEKDNGKEIEVGTENDSDSEIEVVMEENEKESEEDEENEMVNLRQKRNKGRVSKYRNVEVIKRTSNRIRNSEVERKSSLTKSDSDVSPAEKEKKGDGKEQQKGIEVTREKRERRRVSKYGNLEVTKSKKTSKNRDDSEIEKLIAKKKGNLEIMPVEDSEFHDFDKDRKERVFRKGQVWALYDDDDGMPRHYALIEQVVSVSPFEVKLSWLQFLSNGDGKITETGFCMSCGSFRVSRMVSTKYVKLFSHAVDCERAAREVYRVYPKKGSVWALYSNDYLDSEQRNIPSVEDKRCYDIVVSLSSYSDMHGLSIAHLERVPGYRTVFKRKEVGANGVVCLGKNDVALFSHQIPAKKLTGEEVSGLPKDCWELDPASLTP